MLSLRFLFLVVCTTEASQPGNLFLRSRDHGHFNLGLDSGQTLDEAFLGQQDDQKSLKARFPWYHTSAEISAAAQDLQGKCGGALTVKTISQDGVDIDVATVKAKDSTPVNRVFMMFGEHSRELISPESGLYFLRKLCDPATKAAQTLKDSEFQMVLNGNPRSRKAVEGGSFCTRANPAGVDLNRNWDDMWVKAKGNSPGPYPFSEPETRIFRQLVTKYKPTTFLTVHSGTRGLYMPWAYDQQHMATRNQQSMLQILRSVDQDHCQCPFGAAGKEVGYSCPGTCLDWAYDKLLTPYAFAFEIYTNPDMDPELTYRWKEKLSSGGSSLLEAGEHLAHSHFLDFFNHHGSDFVQTRVGSGAGRHHQQEEACFMQFNPDTLDRFNATVENWADAYVQMTNLIVADIKQGRSNLTHHRLAAVLK